MAIIRPFAAIRPAAEKADKIAALPYDVYNRQEAKEAVKGNPDSFLNIDRPETQFEDDFDMYSDEAYEKAKELLWGMVEDGRFIRDEEENYYIYELTMNGRSQTGIVACASIDDYANNIIKKHENTRAEKEADRIHHVDAVGAQTGPIFLAYRHNDVINEVVAKTKETAPVYAFTAEDGISHRVWIISDKDDITKIMKAFADINEIYIADGHHRAASAVKVGQKRRAENPANTGKEEYNYFLSVLFPDEELRIYDYNRVVKDLNGMSEEEFLAKLSEILDIEEIPFEKASPSEAHHFGMYLGGKWYDLAVRQADLNEDPVKGLDVSLLQDLVLEPLFGIQDPKTDARIDFVGGIRGMKELEKRVSEDCKVAFSMYPTSIAQLFAVADAGLLMPPKSTWFEPKLRSGLFIHEI
jgi:uncharacterized protein (DUF1015 family)